MVRPVPGQHERGDQGKHVAGEGRRDAQAGETELGLEERVEGRGQVGAHQEDEDHRSGHGQPCRGGGIPAGGRHGSRAHAEFAEDRHFAAYFQPRQVVLVGARRGMDVLMGQHCGIPAVLIGNSWKN